MVKLGEEKNLDKKIWLLLFNNMEALDILNFSKLLIVHGSGMDMVDFASWSSLLDFFRRFSLYPPSFLLLKRLPGFQL